MRSIILFFRPIISRIQLVYWYIVRPTTSGVKVVITKGHTILLVEHTYYKGLTLPGGGLHRDEVPMDAARREIQEELGITLHDIHELGRIVTEAQYKRDLIYCFRAEMPEQEIRLRKTEIARYVWQDRNDLLEVHSVVREILALY